MKRIFWGFGALEFIWSMLPASLTGGWLGLTNDGGQIIDKLTLLTAVVCIGIGCILHEIQKTKLT